MLEVFTHGMSVSCLEVCENEGLLSSSNWSREEGEAEGLW